MVLSVPSGASAVTKNYTGLVISDEQHEHLVKLGYTEDEIQFMKKEEFEASLAIEGEVISSKTKYYKTTLANGNFQDIEINPLEYSQNKNAIMPHSDGIKTDSYKKITTSIIAVQGIYRYKVSIEWSKFPSVRSNDIIGIGIDNSIVSLITKTNYFQQNYCVTGSIYSSNNENYVKYGTEGVGTVFPLKSGNLKKLSSYFYFSVEKKIECFTESLWRLCSRK